MMAIVTDATAPKQFYTREIMMTQDTYLGMNNVHGWIPGEAPGRGSKPMYVDARFMLFSYVSTREAIQNVLPPPLKPGPDNLVTINVADYPFWYWKDGVRRQYNEVIVFVQCEYEGEVAMTVPFIYIGTRTGDFTDGCDAALIAGRESSGFPKKLANISINREGEGWTATMHRRNTKLLDFSATFDQPIALADLPAMGRVILVKEIMSSDWNTYDVRKVLAMSSDWLKTPKSAMAGTASVTLGSLPDDPLASLKIVTPLSALEMVTDISGDSAPSVVLADLNSRL